MDQQQSQAGWPDFTALLSLEWILLIGSGVLAISLLALSLTRWGQSRPVWKCVLLSLGAHVLLIGYAYGTRLIWNTPTPSAQQTMPDVEQMEVTVLADDPADHETPTRILESDPSTMAGPALPPPELEEDPSPLLRKMVSEPKLPQPPEPEQEALVDTPDLPTPSTRAGQTSDSMVAQDMEVQPLPVAKILDPADVEPFRANPTQLPAAPELTLESDDGQFARRPIENSLPLPAQPESAAVTASPLQPLPRPVEPQLAPSMADLNSLRKLPKSNPGLQLVRRNRRLGDGQPIPRLYSMRDQKNRLATARRQGGSMETEAAVERGLKWLASRQKSDGRWDPSETGAGREDRVYGHHRDGAGAQADCGISALATLAFLGAGYTHLEGEYRQEVNRALEFLISQQKPNGDLAGDAKLFARTYCHSMALLALSEALAMTGDRRLTRIVQRGVDFTQRGQNRNDGGWRYQPGDSGDMSQFGWQVLALHSAELGGAQVSDSTKQGMHRFLKACSSGAGGGLASYQPNQGPSTSMTAEALLCRYFLQHHVKDITRQEAQEQIVRALPSKSHVNLYYWYYGTMAMYHSGGDRWQVWNQAMKSTLLSLQEQSGSEAGSWPATGTWGGYGGTVYSTAMGTLNLEVYYRYSPVYRELADRNTPELR